MTQSLLPPKEYHYRSRLDLKLMQTKKYGVLMGFSPIERYPIIQASACPIAMEAVSDFMPELKNQAIQKLTPKYRNANLVVKTGDDGRVLWGGIGRRSLTFQEKDYLWTRINDRKIFYSLDTFFQANLSILPEVIRRIEELHILGQETCFYDLYGGVGLFGVAFHDQMKKVILVEENIYATRLAQYNVAYHKFQNFEIIPEKVEDRISLLTQGTEDREVVAMIDPPRAGLSQDVVDVLAQAKGIKNLLYLSCHPESLVRDLFHLTKSIWQITKIIPFDFFPKTRHLETLVVLQNKGVNE